MNDLVRIGKPEPKTQSFVDDEGMRHIIFPWTSRNLSRPYLGFQIITYHPYENEAWLWTKMLSEFTDWDSIINMAITLKADYSIGLRIRGVNRGYNQNIEKKHNDSGRFNFEIP